MQWKRQHILSKSISSKVKRFIVVSVLATFALNMLPVMHVLADAQVTIDDYLGNKTGTKSMDNLKAVGDTLIQGDSNGVISGLPAKNLGGKNVVVPLRLALTKKADELKGKYTMVSIADADIKPNLLTTYTKKLAKDGDFTSSELNVGAISCEHFLYAMGSDWADTKNEGDIQLVATKDPDKDLYFSTKTATTAPATPAMGTDGLNTDSTISGGGVKTGSNAGNSIATGDMDLTKCMIVAGFRGKNARPAFTMNLLYQTINAGIKNGTLSKEELLCVDAYGDIITSKGQVILPFFDNNNFMFKPVFNSQLLEYATVPKEDYTGDADKAITESSAKDTGRFTWYPIYLSYLSTDKKSGVASFKTPDSAYEFFVTGRSNAKTPADDKDSKKTATTDTTTKSNTFFQDPDTSATKNSLFTYVNSEEFAATANVRENTIAYVAPFKGASKISDLIEEKKMVYDAESDDKSLRGYTGLYKILSDASTTVFMADAGKEAMTGFDINDDDVKGLIEQILRDPQDYFDKAVTGEMSNIYTAFFPSDAGDGSKEINSVILTRGLFATNIFSWFTKNAILLACLATSIIILFGVWKITMGKADYGWKKIGISILISFLCFIAPIKIYPVVVDLLFDRPSLWLLSSVVNDNLIVGYGDYLQAVRAKSVDEGKFKSNLEGFIMKPNGQDFNETDVTKPTVVVTFVDFMDKDPLVNSIVKDYVKQSFTQDKGASSSLYQSLKDALYSKEFKEDDDIFHIGDMLSAKASTIGKMQGGDAFIDTSTNAVDASARKKLIVTVNERLNSMYISNNEFMYSSLTNDDNIQLISYVIATSMYSTMGEPRSRIYCTNLSIDDLMQSLFIDKKSKNVLNSNTTASTNKVSFLCKYIIAKGSFLSAIPFGIFMFAVALYTFLRCLILAAVLISCSLLFIVVYCVQYDYTNKALFGVLSCLLILAVTHWIFVGSWALLIWLINAL